MSTSNNSNITIFNFEEWLKDHGLSQYKQIFIDVNMTDLANLDVNNESFAKLITDSRLNGDQQIIQHIIKSIQSLHHKSSDIHKLTENIDGNEDTKSEENDQEQTPLTRNKTNDNLLNDIIDEQNHNLDKLINIQNHNKQKYNKHFFKQNEDKLLNYIEKIAMTKSSINDLFESLQISLQSQKEKIMNEITKQQNDALIIKSNINNNKSNGCPIQKCLDLNHKLLTKYSNLLKQTTKRSTNCMVEIDEILTISDNLKTEYTKTIKNFNQNNDKILNYMNDCDYCKLSYPLFNKSIFNEINENINKLTHFEVCCPIYIKILNVNFINDTLIRIQFNVTPQREFKQIEVYYNFEDLSRCDCVSIYDEENTSKCHWFKTTDIESVRYRDNNQNSMIVTINNGHNNKTQLNVKLRFHRICDNSWSGFSNIHSIINESSSPEPLKIKNIFYLSQDLKRNPKGLYIANNKTNTSTSCHVFDLKSPHKSTIRQREKWLIKYSGICYAKNILLPQQIRNKVIEIYENSQDVSSLAQSHKRFNCLFKCGGTMGDTLASKYCSAIVFDDFSKFSIFNDGTSMNLPVLDDIKSESASTKSSDIGHTSANDMFAINWDLPLFPQQTDCNDITYSQHHGLLSCGGWEFRYDSNKFYKLSFNSESYFNQNIDNLKYNNDDYNYWEWEIMPKMNHKRSWPTILMIDDENKLFCIGGKGKLKNVEIFDFNENKWVESSLLNFGRSSCGCFYDKYSSSPSIYIGGGHGALNNIEYLDINKNKWYSNLPLTKKEHGSRPVLWMSDNSNLLYIASIYSDSMEYIDLRMDNKYWNLVYGQNYNQQWHNVFNTHFAKSRNCRLCLS